jgi:preprotein translocase subunit Sec61beta
LSYFEEKDGEKVKLRMTTTGLAVLVCMDKGAWN